MRGLALCLLVIVAVVAVRSQGPPTRTKKGSRPARRGDNVDRGLPSGADVPDGRRFGTRPAPRPAGRAAVPPRRRVAPPRQPGRTQTRAGRRPPPAARRPVQHPAPLQRQPPPSLYQQLFGQASCDAFCDRAGYKPVCTIYGNTYDNDCYRECRNEPRQCENPCPCPADGSDPRPGQPFQYSPYSPFQDSCSYCRDPYAYGEDYNPVCVEDDVTLYNECEAQCKGKTVICSSNCPC